MVQFWKAAQQRAHAQRRKREMERNDRFWSGTVLCRLRLTDGNTVGRAIFTRATGKSYANPIRRDSVSRYAAVDRQRHKSDRNREWAELRWYDRILAVRRASREANPIAARPGKPPQR